MFLYLSCLQNPVPFSDLDFSFLEMNPFTMVNGEPYPLDMRGELDDTAAFKNFKK
jgi:ATP citrate (pro-S)-lyase